MQAKKQLAEFMLVCTVVLPGLGRTTVQSAEDSRYGTVSVAVELVVDRAFPSVTITLN